MTLRLALNRLPLPAAFVNADEEEEDDDEDGRLGDTSITEARFEELSRKHARVIDELRASNDENARLHKIVQDLTRKVDVLSDERDSLRSRLDRFADRRWELDAEPTDVERLAEVYASIVNVDLTEVKSKRTINGVDSYYGVAPWFRQLVQDTFRYVDGKLKGSMGVDCDAFVSAMVSHGAAGSLCEMLRQFQVYKTNKNKLTTKGNHRRIDENLSKEYQRFVEVILSVFAGDAARHTSP